MKIDYLIFNKISLVYCEFDAIKIDKNGIIYGITDNPQEHYEQELKKHEYEISLTIGD